MEILYFLSVAMSLLCIMSNFFKSYLTSSIFDYDPKSSPIVESSNTNQFIYFLLMSIGFAIPTTLAIVLDIASVRKPSITLYYGFFVRSFAVLGTILIYTIVIFWVLPSGRYEYLGSIAAVSPVLCFTTAFDLLLRLGDYLPSKFVYGIAIFSYVGIVLRAYSSVIDSTSLNTTIIIWDSIFFMFVTIISYPWFRYVCRPDHPGYIRLNVAFLTIIPGAILQIITSPIFGLSITPEASSACLLLYQMIPMFPTIVITIVRTSMINKDTILAQVNHTYFFIP